jgi:hypothetical protein
MPFSGLALVRTDVSDERTSSMISFKRISEVKTLAVTSNRKLLQLLVVGNVVSSSLILSP